MPTQPMEPASARGDDYAAIAELYDYVSPYRDRTDVAFYTEVARGCGGAVLEVGSGTGRVLIPIARAGVEITGLDASESMLRVCRNRLSREDAATQARVRLERGDMRSFRLGRAFNLVTLPFRPFQHLTAVEDQCSTLLAARDHLASSGRLVLDLFNPSFEILAATREGEEFGAEPEFSAPDGRRVVRRHRIVSHDRFNQVNNVEIIYDITHTDGKHEIVVHAFPMRYLFRFEAEHLLERCGFEVEKLYAGFDKSQYGSVYPGELIFVARKRP